MDLRETALVGDQSKHWYYRSKFELLLRIVGPVGGARILDVGAGSGVFSRQLLERTGSATATCVDTGYAEDRIEYVGGKTLHFRRHADRSDRDLILFMDVLEHVADDVGLLRGYVREAASGSRFFITVPAFNWLWSEHDDFLGHHRRYTVRDVERVARAAGLTVLRGGYFLGLLLPPVALRRLAGRLAPARQPRSHLRGYGPGLNALLMALGRLDARLSTRNRLGGVSTFVLAAKQ